MCFLRYFILQYTGILRKTGQNGKFIGLNMSGFLQFFPIQVFHDVGLFSPSLGPELECKHSHLWMEGCQVQRTFVKTPKLAILFQKELSAPWQRDDRGELCRHVGERQNQKQKLWILFVIFLQKKEFLLAQESNFVPRIIHLIFLVRTISAIGLCQAR